MVDMVGDVLDRDRRCGVGGFPFRDPGFDRLAVVADDGLEPRFLGGLQRFILQPRGRQEDRHPIGHHHSAIGGEQAQHIVRDVARVIVNPARRGVGEDHRRAAGRNRLTHHLGRDVAEVDQHSEAVHFGDDLETERREAVPLGIVGRAVGPFGGLVMGQSHVARAQAVELTQCGQAAADLAPALDPDQRGDSPGLVNADHVVGGERALEVARVGGDHPVDDVDLFDGLADRLVAGNRAVDIDRPELSADAAGVEPGHVGHQGLGRP